MISTLNNNNNSFKSKRKQKKIYIYPAGVCAQVNVRWKQRTGPLRF
jgi:hypothetical protein